jgi:hypothetical protein
MELGAQIVWNALARFVTDDSPGPPLLSGRPRSMGVQEIQTIGG